jgi:hypothetical protein
LSLLAYADGQVCHFQSLANGGFLASCQAIVARDEAHACTACVKKQAREKAVEVEEVVEPSA